MSAVLEAREPKPLWLEQVSARWQEVLEDKSLRDLPYKVETNRGGQLIMSPAPSNAESELQSKVRLYLDAGAKEGGWSMRRVPYACTDQTVRWPGRRSTWMSRPSRSSRRPDR